MAKSRFEYVRKFELDDRLLPRCWIVVRIDGQNFHDFTDLHKFKKPNDVNGLGLMRKAAHEVMTSMRDVHIAFGQSDEFSFVLRRDTQLHQRRTSKITSSIVSLFSSAYVFYWPQYMVEPLSRIPSFDSRAILYPTNRSLRDYLSWRQADVHVNNLYNTVYWALVQQGGLTGSEATKRLTGTVSGEKNEILFSEFGINYNNEPQQFRKGTILVKEIVENAEASEEAAESSEEKPKAKKKAVKDVRYEIRTHHTDIIKDAFWAERPYLIPTDE